MDPEYTLRYRELFEKHWWWRARQTILLEELRRIRPDGSWGSILDVGCGDGFFFPALALLGEVEGVEPEAVLVSEKGRRWGTIYCMPFDDRFQPGKRYSLILMLDVLEHLADPEAAVRHALRLLEPEGTLLITIPAFRLLWTSHDEINHHLNRYTRRSFKVLADRAEMSVFVSRYFFHWLFPLKLGVRITEAVTGRGPAIPHIPPSWLNRAFITISTLEYRSLRLLRIPFGSSLMVIGSHET